MLTHGVGFREYIVTPTLHSALRSAKTESSPHRDADAAEGSSWWAMRANKLPDSAISGALTGGILNAWKRESPSDAAIIPHILQSSCLNILAGGRPGILPGASTAAIVCTVLQLVYNELGVARVKYVSRMMQNASPQPSKQVGTDSTPALAALVPAVVSSDSETPKRPMSERILTALGFHKISDDDYIAMMKRKRDGYLRRIAELEKERDSERKASPPGSDHTQLPRP